MNAAHWHLLVNHLPVLGVPFGLLLLVASLRTMDRVLQRTGFAILLGAGVAAGLAYLTGGSAEETVEQVVTGADSMIEAHEDAASLGLAAAAALGTLALAALWRTRRAALGRRAVLAFITIGTAAALTLAWVANLGGQIRHAEIRPSGVVLQPHGPDEERE